jgi:dTDP-4-dehydrorhamnose 3,5-epimerase
MQIEPLSIDGALTIVPRAFADERGYFKEIFRSTLYAQAGLAGPFVQDNVSKSKAGVLRGLHGDPRMGKLVQVLHGSAYDVIADIRKDSPTFGRWVGVPLTAASHTQVYIPAGCLHGFLSLEDETLLVYKQTAEYDPSTEIGIAWNDPSLGIEWPLGGRAPRLSPKDAKNPTLRELGYL